MYFFKKLDTFLMNSVPGVITLWSQCAASTSESGTSKPSFIHRSASFFFLVFPEYISCALLNRLPLCWFILALGATPSMAM